MGMHESTRRRLCRAAFWLVCVLPTALVLGWCHWQRQPGRVAEAEALLSSLTGLTARVATVSRPRPGVVRLVDVQLREPESSAEVASCERLEIRRYRNLIKVSLEGAQLDADRTGSLWPAIDRRMQRWQADWPAVTAHSPEIAVRSQHGKLTLRASDCDLAGLQYAGDEVKGWLKFCLKESDNAGAVTVFARRQKQASRPTTQFELTSAPWLPAWLLADVCPPLAQVHPQARLRGKLNDVACTAAGWEAKLEGVDLRGQELLRVLSRKLPALGEWPLHVRIEHAVLRRGRIDSAEGRVHGSVGEVSAATLARIERALGLTPPPRREVPPKARIAFDELHAGFRLDHEGLRLTGLCRGPVAGVVLRGAQGPLVTLRGRGPRAAETLLDMFAQENAGAVPAGAATEGLLSLLPTPLLFEVSSRQFDERR